MLNLNEIVNDTFDNELVTVTHWSLLF